MKQYDYGVVGAGIVGLAHAYALARRGHKVIVFERNPGAMGASVRNFGLVWPLGQSSGEVFDLSLRSREIWQSLIREMDAWSSPTGALVLAHHEDEMAVLSEFTEKYGLPEGEYTLLGKQAVKDLIPFANAAHLQGGLRTSLEITINPREFLSIFPRWLHENLGVEFVYETTILGFDTPRIWSGAEEWRVEQLFWCSGDQLQGPFADALGPLEFRHCKLQMLRARTPYQGRLPCAVASGLSLRHYPSFQECPSILSLKERVAREMPMYDHYGIHLLISQHGDGLWLIGDSHEFGVSHDPFLNSDIETLVLDYLGRMIHQPKVEIVERWVGTYAGVCDQPYVVIEPQPGVRVVTGLAGRGMTLGFGLAEKIVSEGAG